MRRCAAHVGRRCLALAAVLTLTGCVEPARDTVGGDGTSARLRIEVSYAAGVHAAAKAQLLRMARAGGTELLLASILEFDRPAGRNCQMGAQVFDQHLLLAAEAAADTRFHDTDPADRQAEQGRNHAAYVKGDLGAGANDQPVIFIPVGNDNVRLDARLLHLVDAVFALEYKVGRFKRGVDVIMVHKQFHGDVAFGVVDHLRVRFVVDHRRAGLHRFLGRKNRWQLLVLDFDPFQRLLHQFRGLRGYCRNPVADIAHL